MEANITGANANNTNQSAPTAANTTAANASQSNASLLGAWGIPSKLSEVTYDEGRQNDDNERFLICDDCQHNTITFTPGADGACFCDCH
jgi:hypothetical protein